MLILDVVVVVALKLRLVLLLLRFILVLLFGSLLVTLFAVDDDEFALIFVDELTIDADVVAYKLDTGPEETPKEDSTFFRA